MKPTLALLAGLLVLGALVAVFPRSVDRADDDAIDALSPEERRAAEELLDGFHAAAARADFADYFGRFAPGATFVGTDPSEVWDLATFEAYARPHFAAGRGWEYRPLERHLRDLGPNALAFHEALEHAEYGRMRGSGALVHGTEGWRIALYVLSFAVPNDRASAVVRAIDSTPETGRTSADPAPEHQ